MIMFFKEFQKYLQEIFQICIPCEEALAQPTTTQFISEIVSKAVIVVAPVAVKL